MVEAVAVVVEAGFGIEVLRREAVAEEAGAPAGFGDEPAEGIVGVPRKGAAVDVKVAREVAVVVVAWNVDRAVDREIEQRHSCRFTMTRQSRSGKSAANRDFQLLASRGDNARAVRPPQAAPARFCRRPTSEVGSPRFLYCASSHKFLSFWFRDLSSPNAPSLLLLIEIPSILLVINVKFFYIVAAKKLMFLPLVRVFDT